MYTAKERKQNFERTKKFKARKGGKVKANVAMEAPISDEYEFALVIQTDRKSLPKDSWLLDSAAYTSLIMNHFSTSTKKLQDIKSKDLELSHE